MEYILSKIINRPKSVEVQSADGMENSINTDQIEDESPNIRSARKSFDSSGGGDSIKSEKTDKEDKKIVILENDQGSSVIQTNLNNWTDTSNKASGDIGNSTILPDIINVQPVLNCAESSIASETENGDKNSLTVPNSGTIEIQSVASSDDELFSECQAYSGPPSTHDSEINQSKHWDNVVSSVIIENIENLENTVAEQHDLSAETSEPNTTIVDDGSLVDAIIDSNLNAKSTEDVTFNISNETSDEKQISNENDTNDTPLQPLNITDADLKSENANNTSFPTSEQTSNEPIIIEQQQNEDTSSDQRSESIASTNNSQAIPEFLSSTFNLTVNSAEMVETNKTLDGTFDAGQLNNSSAHVDKIKEEKSLENELKACKEGILRRPSVEPMDVDISPQKIFDSMPVIKKEQSMKISPKAGDVFVENFVSDKIDVMFKTPSLSGPILNKRRSQNNQQQDIVPEDEFKHNGLILNPSDFDFLLSKGSNNVVSDRSSLLLKFDPLVGQPVAVGSQEHKGNNINTSSDLNNTAVISPPFDLRLSPAIEEEESQENEFLHDHFVFESNLSSNNSTASKPNESTNVSNKEIIVPERDNQETLADYSKNSKLLKDKINQNQPEDKKKNEKMSVDVIQDMKVESDAKIIDNINAKTDEKQDYKMADLEKKIKNEVLKTEDIEKKFKDAEQREEALLKRITEKDKTIAKMSGVVEAYEKAIAELIADKEQIIQNYEAQLEELKKDRDVNYQHLTSLEATFSDLHAKYERSKHLTASLKASQQELTAEKNKNMEDLRLQEQRYDKMKSHAMQQLDIANNKLESMLKNHALETAKLKALLKKEEISRLSMAEQLQQKSRENEELVKICDELINGQGS